jgi:toxin ParE1/3/4
MRIRWTPEASTDLECIARRIAEDNSEAAVRAAGKIFQRIENLANFPQAGRTGREEGTRELVLARRCLTSPSTGSTTPLSKFSASGMVLRIESNQPKTAELKHSDLRVLLRNCEPPL